jgi:hypothetical protein
MKSLFPVVVALILTASAAAQSKTVFPPPGTPYADAKAMLLKQGVRLAPDRARQPNKQFHECDEDSGKWLGKPFCNAYFLESADRGWKYYVIVPVYLGTLTVADVHYPSTPEGHPPIPGPFPKGVPAIRNHTYFAARNILKGLGYRPARNQNSEAGYNNRCADPNCKRTVHFNETDCSGTGMAYCTAYWIAPDKRVLRITTIGEFPMIHFAEWSSWKDLKNDFGKLPD